jgi:hypothetical protein
MVLYFKRNIYLFIYLSIYYSFLLINILIANQKKVQFDLDLTFGQLLEQESKEKAKNVEVF